MSAANRYALTLAHLRLDEEDGDGREGDERHGADDDRRQGPAGDLAVPDHKHPP